MSAMVVRLPGCGRILAAQTPLSGLFARSPPHCGLLPEGAENFGLAGHIRRPCLVLWPTTRARKVAMTPRLDYFAAAPQLMKAMLNLEKAVASSGLEHSLIKLMETRASQINGCAFCIDMHTRDARKAGEGEARLYLLDAWREAPHYTPRERAALAWTEALTLVARTRAPDADYEALKPHFSEEEIVKLTLLIVTINGWNRLSIGFRAVPPLAAAPPAAAAA
jgi:AhpD family alkylhydroperoxidase